MVHTYTNVPVSGILIKEKALYYAKELNFEKSQASDGWFRQVEEKVWHILSDHCGRI